MAGGEGIAAALLRGTLTRATLIEGFAAAGGGGEAAEVAWLRARRVEAQLAVSTESMLGKEILLELGEVTDLTMNYTADEIRLILAKYTGPGTDRAKREIVLKQFSRLSAATELDTLISLRINELEIRALTGPFGP
jgi:hypothetical protein